MGFRSIKISEFAAEESYFEDLDNARITLIVLQLWQIGSLGSPKYAHVVVHVGSIDFGHEWRVW